MHDSGCCQSIAPRSVCRCWRWSKAATFDLTKPRKIKIRLRKSRADQGHSSITPTALLLPSVPSDPSYPALARQPTSFSPQSLGLAQPTVIFQLRFSIHPIDHDLSFAYRIPSLLTAPLHLIRRHQCLLFFLSLLLQYYPCSRLETTSVSSFHPVGYEEESIEASEEYEDGFGRLRFPNTDCRHLVQRFGLLRMRRR